ncbi:YceI family protein [Colwellia sp. E2M01]|uniref:YceI family protein n=1 Tax=Colwellia sp. E2M01 TaxID=2841561 RepID=UPI001C08E6C3|nr:YceI family protein [Colwellia sp. E2M01]MBU2872179.1 YceI family protein [Colwellia sp. E2M01]
MKNIWTNNVYSKIGGVLLAGLFSTMAHADWSLDSEQSNVNFISIKKNTTAEVHHFEQLTGSLNDKNIATVAIDLNSVSTAIAIRDERMKKELFETTKFPLATITTAIDGVASLTVGSVTVKSVDLAVTLHGETHTYPAQVQITKVDNNTVTAVTTAPIIVNAGDFKLLAGIEKLRELAGLPSIATAVPVTANLLFTQAK